MPNFFDQPTSTSKLTSLNCELINTCDCISSDFFDESFAKQYYQNNLTNYLFICTYKDCLYLNGLYYKDNEDSLSQANLGRVDLLNNYCKYKFGETTMNNMPYGTMLTIKALSEYSRYEFIFVSDAMKVLILGNRQGDVHLYSLEIKVTNSKMGINDVPIAIIDCMSRIAGMRIVDHLDEMNPMNNYVEIFVMKLNGLFQCFKFKYS
jgi:hypothetical protein